MNYTFVEEEPTRSRQEPNRKDDSVCSLNISELASIYDKNQKELYEDDCEYRRRLFLQNMVDIKQRKKEAKMKRIQSNNNNIAQIK